VAVLQASVAVGALKVGVAVHSIVVLPPALPIVGGWVSIAVITWVLVAEWLPQASVASQLLVTVFTHPLPPVTSPKIFTVAPLQSSLAVGAVKDSVAVQSIVAFVPAAPIVGAWVSIAVITWVTVAEWLPQASVASHVWVYILAQEVPVVVLLRRFTFAVPQVFDAVGAVKFGVAVQSIVALAPAWLIAGAPLPSIVIICVLVAEWLPQASVASQVLVNTVTVHEVPVAVLLSMFTVDPLQSSLAVGAVNDGVAVQSMVAFVPAAPIVGACVSVAVITWVTVAEWLPQASVASHVWV
jgi:hypothetical protein